MDARFYFGAISPYSWFAAERIGELLPDARWVPVFAGGLFRSAGRVSWGITGDRETGIADCERRAEQHGLGPMRWPEGWPANDVLTARAMVAAEREGRLVAFALAAMRACFRDGADTTRPEAVAEVAAAAGLDGVALLEAAGSAPVKEALRANNDEAVAAGVIGVPTVVVDGEAFWGDDRLDEAAARAARA